MPTATPTFTPTFSPTSTPTTNPSMAPTDPTTNPTASPTKLPTFSPIGRANCRVDDMIFVVDSSSSAYPQDEHGGPGSNTLFSFSEQKFLLEELYWEIYLTGSNPNVEILQYFDRKQFHQLDINDYNLSSKLEANVVVDIIRSMELYNDDPFVANDILNAMEQAIEDLFDFQLYVNGSERQKTIVLTITDENWRIHSNWCKKLQSTYLSVLEIDLVIVIMNDDIPKQNLYCFFDTHNSKYLSSIFTHKDLANEEGTLDRKKSIHSLLLRLCLPGGVSTPTWSPSAIPTSTPTFKPTSHPSVPTTIYTDLPTTDLPAVFNFSTTEPSNSPTPIPTHTLSNTPTFNPAAFATLSPSKKPTQEPIAATLEPTINPTRSPTKLTRSPSKFPTEYVTTDSPSQTPSLGPTRTPTEGPSLILSEVPTHHPTESPIWDPTHNPTQIPAAVHTNSPSIAPSNPPTSLTCCCSPTWDKVCGQDGFTYPNPCLAECFGVVIDYYGECEIPDCGNDTSTTLPPTPSSQPDTTSPTPTPTAAYCWGEREWNTKCTDTKSPYCQNLAEDNCTYTRCLNACAQNHHCQGIEFWNVSFEFRAFVFCDLCTSADKVYIDTDPSSAVSVTSKGSCTTQIPTLGPTTLPPTTQPIIETANTTCFFEECLEECSSLGVKCKGIEWWEVSIHSVVSTRCSLCSSYALEQALIPFGSVETIQKKTCEPTGSPTVSSHTNGPSLLPSKQPSKTLTRTPTMISSLNPTASPTKRIDCDISAMAFVVDASFSYFGDHANDWYLQTRFLQQTYRYLTLQSPILPKFTYLEFDSNVTSIIPIEEELSVDQIVRKIGRSQYLSSRALPTNIDVAIVMGAIELMNVTTPGRKVVFVMATEIEFSLEDCDGIRNDWLLENGIDVVLVIMTEPMIEKHNQQGDDQPFKCLFNTTNPNYVSNIFLEPIFEDLEYLIPRVATSVCKGILFVICLCDAS
ncbi:laminin G, domain-containing 2 [Reticulomyxa filosa]|uniref:Laminin G, domain-containing 2 n=1 Tax=Reticulomyxa filosa TaxID=46433 RepID=X6NYL7_RETFI|nr:laminin G, domain-containing 2 [Reticulomyxa filosa]|eukprot:ETO31385.1 laminin G, domain-containing 2 [Reticulomyxa filosa]